LERDELGEELRARHSRGLSREGRRDDGLETCRGGFNVLGDGDGDAGRAHVVEIRRLVAIPTGDLGAPGLREHRIAGKPRAADAYEPELPVT